MELWGRFCVWHPKCKHYVLNSSLVPFLLCAFIMYIVHFRTLCVLLRCHLRGSVLSQCGVCVAELGLPRGLGTRSPWFPCTFPCPPRVWGWSRSPRQPHSPPSPGLGSPACLSSPPHLILTDKEGGGGASALLLCPAGKWKEKKEGAFSLSHWIRWWIEQSRHGHDNLWRRFSWGSQLPWELQLPGESLTGKHVLSIGGPPPHTGVVPIFLKKS